MELTHFPRTGPGPRLAEHTLVRFGEDEQEERDLFEGALLNHRLTLSRFPFRLAPDPNSVYVRGNLNLPGVIQAISLHKAYRRTHSAPIETIDASPYL